MVTILRSFWQRSHGYNLKKSFGCYHLVCENLEMSSLRIDLKYV